MKSILVGVIESMTPCHDITVVTDGFDHPAALTQPCQVVHFKRLLIKGDAPSIQPQHVVQIFFWLTQCFVSSRGLS